jgi:hypothetical protein
MSDAHDPTRHGGRNDPEFRVGRGKPARRRIAALAIGIIVVIFAVLLTIWFLGRSAADAQGAAAAGTFTSHPGYPGPGVEQRGEAVRRLATHAGMHVLEDAECGGGARVAGQAPPGW